MQTAWIPEKPMTIKQLKAIRFVLLCEHGYAAMDGLKCCIVPMLKDALVFDGRDNEVRKAEYYSAALKTKFVPEFLPS